MMIQIAYPFLMAGMILSGMTSVGSVPPEALIYGTNSEELRNRHLQAKDLVYKGTATDEQSGISQTYTLYIKPDFKSASIGGGPFYPLENQGDGTYMWLDGTIIGMSIKPMRDKCIVYGSEGLYFCTLSRKI